MLLVLVPCSCEEGVCGAVPRYGIVHAYARIDPAEGTVEAQDLLLISVEDVGGEAAVCLEHLAGHCAPQAVIALGQVANVVSVGVHDDVAVRLLKAHQHVHHLELALDDNG